MITGGTDIGVVTGRIVERVDTPILRIAPIRCANVAIIAVLQPIVAANASFAMVPGSALVAVITRQLRRLVQTTGDGATRINGARVAIVAK